ncbi:hypothetical protein [Cupriavidus lacunae]|uniref:hypothetical protein n=1 Tax=Cupriavidus lacunae TaxID=2666307 RepID=UPI0031342531
MHGRQHQGVVGRFAILLAQKQKAFREWTVQPRQDVIGGIDSAFARVIRHKLEHPFAHAIENEGTELAFTERLAFRQLLLEVAILVRGRLGNQILLLRNGIFLVIPAICYHFCFLLDSCL